VLRQSLLPQDRFLNRDGPDAIALAYARMALKAAGNGQLDGAEELIDRGHAIAPASKVLAEAQEQYAGYQQLDEYLTAGPVPDVRRVRGEISELYAQDPQIAQVVVPALARHLASRLHSTRDPRLATELAQAGSAIFGDGPPFHRN
jgi:hypothetical protein